jgi:hypothetical protein
LTDFGLATTNPFPEDYGSGSVSYTSPESLEGAMKYQQRCTETQDIFHNGLLDDDEDGPCGYDAVANDVWSVGVILFNLLTTKNPWYSAALSDEGYMEFQSWLRDMETEDDMNYIASHPSPLRSQFGLSFECDLIFRCVFHPDPRARCSLDALLDLVKGVTRFVDPFLNQQVSSTFSGVTGPSSLASTAVMESSLAAPPCTRIPSPNAFRPPVDREDDSLTLCSGKSVRRESFALPRAWSCRSWSSDSSEMDVLGGNDSESKTRVEKRRAASDLPPAAEDAREEDDGSSMKTDSDWDPLAGTEKMKSMDLNFKEVISGISNLVAKDLPPLVVDPAAKSSTEKVVWKSKSRQLLEAFPPEPKYVHPHSPLRQTAMSPFKPHYMDVATSTYSNVSHNSFHSFNGSHTTVDKRKRTVSFGNNRSKSPNPISIPSPTNGAPSISMANSSPLRHGHNVGSYRRYNYSHNNHLQYHQHNHHHNQHHQHQYLHSSRSRPVNPSHLANALQNLPLTDESSNRLEHNWRQRIYLPPPLRRQQQQLQRQKWARFNGWGNKKSAKK